MPTLLLVSSTHGSVSILFYLFFSLCLILSSTAILPPITPAHITTLGKLTSLGGFTLLLSLLSDLLSLLTAHLRLAYELTCGVYWGAGVKLGGGLLWGVFRGTWTHSRNPAFSLTLFFPYTKRKKTQRPTQSYRHLVLWYRSTSIWNCVIHFNSLFIPNRTGILCTFRWCRSFFICFVYQADLHTIVS